MIPPDALQVLALAHAKGAHEGDYPRIKDYFEEVRTAFVGSDSNYLVRELGLLVLSPERGRTFGPTAKIFSRSRCI
jgi:hypothetical protein